MMKLRAQRLEAGLCATCGGKLSGDGKKTCQSCRDYQNRWGENKRRIAAVNGLCKLCKRLPKVESKTMCIQCREKTSERNRRLYEKRATFGLCNYCGKSIGAGGTMRRCAPCRLKYNEGQQQRRKGLRDKSACVDCGRKTKSTKAGKSMCKKCSAKDNKRTRENKRSLKEGVFLAYGGWKCNCCGETTKEFLQIDHINGNGRQHRSQIGGGQYLCQWLKRNGFPDGFQILCANCNFGKLMNRGVCPHKQQKEAAVTPEGKPVVAKEVVADVGFDHETCTLTVKKAAF